MRMQVFALGDKYKREVDGQMFEMTQIGEPVAENAARYVVQSGPTRYKLTSLDGGGEIRVSADELAAGYSLQDEDSVKEIH